MGLSRGKICLKKGEDKGFCIYLERVIRKIWACVVCVFFFLSLLETISVAVL